MAGKIATASIPPPDFFVSYTAVDEDWAEVIAWWLEKAGFTTFIQKWDFRPGNNFVLMMQRGMSARHMIAVLSPAYLEAAYCETEWAAALAQDPKGERRKLIPVRVRHCKPAGLLCAISYIDLVGLPKSEGRKRLLAGLRDRNKPKKGPPFPGDIATERDASSNPSHVGGHSNG